jgi:hypothetical protein
MQKCASFETSAMPEEIEEESKAHGGNSARKHSTVHLLRKKR